MYCPHCGAESIPGFKYCKRCGVNFTVTADQSPGKQKPTTVKQTGAAVAIAFATVAICLGGLGIVFGVASSLLDPSLVGQLTPIIITMIVFGSLTVFGLAAMLIRLFTRLIAGPKEVPVQTQIEIPVYTQARLPEAPVAMPSVTENTTRNFDPKYREPMARE